MEEMFHGTHSKVSKFAPEEDVISSMPDNVITNILDRLPIQDAVKTDVLSKKWRFKWTLLTQLVFDKNFFEYLQKKNPDEPYKYNGRDITRLLLHLKGSITKFVLYIPYSNEQLLDAKDFCHWVLFLSRKGIKDFTLIHNYNSILTRFKMPTQFFSCTELTHLKLERHSFRLSPSFNGFPNLLSLDLYHVSFGSYKCWEFLARSPLLEILKINTCGPIAELELNEIAKLVKLKIVYLNLLWVENLKFMITKLSPLPKLQELTLDFDYRPMSLAEDGAELKFHFAFLCLKTLALYNVDFDCDIRRSFVFKMICGCPNLKTLDITVTYTKVMSRHQNLLPDIQSMGHPQLQSAVFAGFRGSENEVCLIEFLLARSPLLKKIGIGLNSSNMVGGVNVKFMFANKLLKLYRASPVVKIDLY